MSRERRSWGEVDLVQHFKENYSHITSRIELQKTDGGFYNALHRSGRMDDVLPGRRCLEGDGRNYFRDHYEGKIKTRGELQKKDPGLYRKLREEGALNDVLPEVKRRDFGKISAEQIFNEKYRGKVTARNELQKVDNALYQRLRKEKLLDNVLPEIERRDFSKVSSVEVFNTQYKGKIVTRSQLFKEDKGLYSRLRREGLLEVVLPTTRYRDYSKTDDIQLFNELYRGKITTRKELEKQDKGLYARLYREGKLDVVFPKENGLDDILRDYAEGDA